MSEMVEIIGEAIYSDLCGIGTATWEDAYRVALAALEALRIPTPEMLEAANAAGSDLSPALPQEIWPAMIDAAIGKGL